MFSLRVAWALCGALAAAGCEQGLTPSPVTAPPSAATPFIVSSPDPYTGPAAPDVGGTWTGTAVFVDCRSAPPRSCLKVSPGGRSLSLLVEQQGRDLIGSFTMDGIEGGVSAFAGYVTAAGGLAGTATGNAETRVLVRLGPGGTGLTGEVSDETRSDGSLVFTRHFVVAAPLVRRSR